jgi:hypothetical protein
MNQKDKRKLSGAFKVKVVMEALSSNPLLPRYSKVMNCIRVKFWRGEFSQKKLGQ